MLTFQRFFLAYKMRTRQKQQQTTYLGLIVVQKSYMGLSKKIINLNNSRHENIHFVQADSNGQVTGYSEPSSHVFFGAGGQPWNH